MGTRAGMCYGGWEVRVLGDYIIICYVYVNIVGFTVPYYVCRNYMYIYNLNIYIYIHTHIYIYIYIQSAMLIQKCVTIVIVGTIIYLICYYIYCCNN